MGDELEWADDAEALAAATEEAFLAEAAADDAAEEVYYEEVEVVEGDHAAVEAAAEDGEVLEATELFDESAEAFEAADGLTEAADAEVAEADVAEAAYQQAVAAAAAAEAAAEAAAAEAEAAAAAVAAEEAAKALEDLDGTTYVYEEGSAEVADGATFTTVAGEDGDEEVEYEITGDDGVEEEIVYEVVTGGDEQMVDAEAQHEGDLAPDESAVVDDVDTAALAESSPVGEVVYEELVEVVTDEGMGSSALPESAEEEVVEYVIEDDVTMQDAEEGFAGEGAAAAEEAIPGDGADAAESTEWAGTGSDEALEEEEAAAADAESAEDVDHGQAPMEVDDGLASAADIAEAASLEQEAVDTEAACAAAASAEAAVEDEALAFAEAAAAAAEAAAAEAEAAAEAAAAEAAAAAAAMAAEEALAEAAEAEAMAAEVEEVVLVSTPEHEAAELETVPMQEEVAVEASPVQTASEGAVEDSEAGPGAEEEEEVSFWGKAVIKPPTAKRRRQDVVVAEVESPDVASMEDAAVAEAPDAAPAEAEAPDVASMEVETPEEEPQVRAAAHDHAVIQLAKDDASVEAPTPDLADVPQGGEEAGGEPMTIDGSLLEGGGQVLRTSFALAALLRQHVRISNVRAMRLRPGLAMQHVAALRLIADVARGKTSGCEIGSYDVTFRPQKLTAGTFSADPGTSGPVTLAMQAVLVPLLFTGEASSCTLRGGTDVPHSPPLDFMTRVLRPIVQRMGADFTLHTHSRGFFPGGGGWVQLEVPRLQQRLQCIDLSNRGRPLRARGVLHTTHPLGLEELSAIEAVRCAAAAFALDAKAEMSLEPGPEGKYKCWVDIIVETTGGALFYGSSEPVDLPYGGRLGQLGGFLGVARLAAASAREARSQVKDQLDTGAAVAGHLCDHLILPAALALGTSRLLVDTVSLHTETVLDIATKMLPGFKYREEPVGDLTLLVLEGVGQPVPGTEDEATPSRAWSLAQAKPKSKANLTVVPPAFAKATPKSALKGAISKASPQLLSVMPPLLRPVPSKAPPPWPLQEERKVRPPLQRAPSEFPVPRLAPEAPSVMRSVAKSMPATSKATPALSKAAPPPAKSVSASPGLAPVASKAMAPSSKAPAAAAPKAAVAVAGREQTAVAAPATSQAPAKAAQAPAPAIAPAASSVPEAAAGPFTSIVGGPEDEALVLNKGALAAAPPELIADLRRDMGELAEMAHIKIEIDVAGNRLVLKGRSFDRKAAQPDLREVLAFYFPG